MPQTRERHREYMRLRGFTEKLDLLMSEVERAQLENVKLYCQVARRAINAFRELRVRELKT